jgi:hypothetical protein
MTSSKQAQKMAGEGNGRTSTCLKGCCDRPLQGLPCFGSSNSPTLNFCMKVRATALVMVASLVRLELTAYHPNRNTRGPSNDLLFSALKNHACNDQPCDFKRASYLKSE